MREDIIDWIRAEYGCAASVGIYRKIEQWEDWWRGKCRGFHEYWENSVSGGPIRRELYSLRMAKKIVRLKRIKTRISIIIRIPPVVI